MVPENNKKFNWELASKTAPMVYKTILTQTGTAAPTALIMENTLRPLGELTWTRVSPGYYTGNLTFGTFVKPNTFVVATMAYTTGGAFAVNVTVSAAGQIQVRTFDAAGVAADLKSELYLQVSQHLY
jgi:hypothetical protein